MMEVCKYCNTRKECDHFAGEGFICEECFSGDDDSFLNTIRHGKGYYRDEFVEMVVRLETNTDLLSTRCFRINVEMHNVGGKIIVKDYNDGYEYKFDSFGALKIFFNLGGEAFPHEHYFLKDGALHKRVEWGNRETNNQITLRLKR